MDQAANRVQPIPGVVGSGLGAAANFSKWLKNVCCWSSPWKYQADSKGNWQPQYDDFGNFNFGATGTALGLPSPVVMSGGGLAKNWNYWSKGQWNPYWVETQDTPKESDLVLAGGRAVGNWRLLAVVARSLTFEVVE
jgi:hypothetical protein